MVRLDSDLTQTLALPGRVRPRSMALRTCGAWRAAGKRRRTPLGGGSRVIALPYEPS